MLTITGMARMKRAGTKTSMALPSRLFASVAKELLDLLIHQANATLAIHDDHGCVFQRS